MIPLFPTLKSISIEDKDDIEKYVNLYPPYSDYNFASLWVWNTKEDILASRLNDNLVIKFNDYLTQKPCYSFLGTNNVSNTIRELLEQTAKEQLPPTLKLIPDVSIRIQNSILDEFSIEEDHDNFDYIYSIPGMVELKGYKYARKRNYINRFKKLYQPIHKIVDLTDTQTQKEIMTTAKIWAKTRRKNYSETKNEFLAIKRATQYAAYLKLFVIGLFVESKMIGFSINDILDNGFAMTLFEKADITFKGVFPYLKYVTSYSLLKQNCKFLNFESDMGIPGLRKSKLSYHPDFFLKKYIVSR